MWLRTSIKHLPLQRLLSTITPIRTLTSISIHQEQEREREQDPFSLMKEDPIQVCSSLWVRTFSNQTHTPFSNLTGFLSKFDLWVLAYQRSCAHFTGSFPPRNAIHSQVLRHLLSLQNAVVRGRFSWNNKIHSYIRSPNEKPLTEFTSKRKIQSILESDAPCFQDRVVQEVLLLILEPIFEAQFSSKSHAFRPGRNAHTVIRTIRSNFAGYLWFLRGDVSEIFENVDTDMVMGYLEKYVKDEKVLGLIKLALRARVRNQAQGGDGSVKFGKKKKKGPKKKKILNENEPKPDPFWLRSFFSFAPEEAAKYMKRHAQVIQIKCFSLSIIDPALEHS